MNTKRDEALHLAEDLLSDIELKRLEPIDIARKASRLARLTDDVEAMSWLSYEIAGYPEGVKTLDTETSKAGRRSNRSYLDKKSVRRHRIKGLGQVQATIDTANIQLTSTPGSDVVEQKRLRDLIVENRGLLDRVVGSFHVFAANKYQELRFGTAVENVFEGIRSTVDANIAKLVPDALPILTTALENAQENNPEQWKNAAKACRDLIKTTADTLRPAGKPKNGRSMSDSSYINRLVDWIETNSSSNTMASLVVGDLNDLGNRLDAVTNGGNKGAHAKVAKQEASRLIVGTYMLIGDILSLSEKIPDTNASKHHSTREAEEQDPAVEGTPA